MKIKSFIISKNNPFIIAEISGNHNGNISLLKKTILAAKNSGVDAVKLQTYSAKDLTINTKNNHEMLIKIASIKPRFIVIVILVSRHYLETWDQINVKLELYMMVNKLLEQY